LYLGRETQSDEKSCQNLSRPIHSVGLGQFGPKNGYDESGNCSKYPWLRCRSKEKSQQMHV
jgi:hypothetical protein